MRSFIAAAAACSCMMLVAGDSSAHHSMAMFDQDREVLLSGTVRQFQWTNPHAYIQLDAENSAGEAQEWSLEMGSPVYLYARGWRPRTLRAGTEVRVRLNPLRSGRPGGAVLEVSDAEGNAIGSNRR